MESGQSASVVNRRASLPAVAGVAVLVLAGCGDTTPEKATGSPAPSSPAAGAGPSTAASPAPVLKPGDVRVAGQVDKPYTVTLASLRGLPQKSVEVEYASAKGQQKHTYQGVLLHDVLKDAQPRFDASKKNRQLRRVVAATIGPFSPGRNSTPPSPSPKSCWRFRRTESPSMTRRVRASWSRRTPRADATSPS